MVPLVFWGGLQNHDGRTLSRKSLELIELLGTAYEKLPEDLKKEEDHRWAICRVLLARHEVDLLLNSWRTSKDPVVRRCLVEMVLYQIDDSQITKAFRSRLSDTEDDEAFYIASYLAKLGDSAALAVLNNHFYQYGISSLEWSYSMALFGKFGYRPAIPHLVEALNSASMNVIDASFDSLSQLYPDAPTHFDSLSEAQTYFANRMKAEFGDIDLIPVKSTVSL